MFDRFRRSRDQQPDDTYLGLRRMILQTDPPAVGLALKPQLPRVWGLVMDTTYKKGGYTLVALVDGTTSLYWTTGGGILGGGEFARVSEATRAALLTVEAHLDELPPSTDDALPPTDQVVLRALTYDGPRAIQAPENDLGEGRHPHAPIFHAAHDVITELRLLQESR